MTLPEQPRPSGAPAGAERVGAPAEVAARSAPEADVAVRGASETDVAVPGASEAEVAGPQAAAAVVAQPTPPSAPAVLDAEQRALLRAALNRIIPPRDEALPGAGDLDVGASIERTLAISAGLRRLFLDGLLAITLTSPAPFKGLDPAQQTAVLERIEQRAPAFFVALVEHAYRGYYTHPRVVAAFGAAARPPQPLGHQLPVFDPALLAQQRQRPPFWRPA